MTRLYSILPLLLASIACDQNPPNKPAPVSAAQVTTPITAPNSSGISLLDEESESMSDKIDGFTQTPPADDSIITIQEYVIDKPATWFWLPPKSTIVSANYVVPSVGKNESALFSATFFNEGEGGHFTENIVRWKSMFRSNDGAPVKPEIVVIEVNGHDAVVAEFHGEYMGAGAAWHLKDHALLVAEVREPTGNIYFKVIGPRETLDAHKEAFLQAIKSMRKLN